MGNNNEIRQRMETYRKVLLAIVWIVAIGGVIGGIAMMNNPYLKAYGIWIAVLIVSILEGIFGHFLVNVGLAIPFILLNNGDYLAAIVPEGKHLRHDIENINARWKCPKCNNENPNSTYQCGSCGYKLV